MPGVLMLESLVQAGAWLADLANVPEDASIVGEYAGWATSIMLIDQATRPDELASRCTHCFSHVLL